MPQVIIILGSRSDKQVVEESKMLDILDDVGASWELSIISAHRNSDKLQRYCAAMKLSGALVFIGVAGMAAHLPGAIATNVHARLPVIGVPLVSDILDGLDALFSMARMPKGIPVAVTGIGESALYNAAILACQIIALKDGRIERGLNDFFQNNQKVPEMKIQSSEKRR